MLREVLAAILSSEGIKVIGQLGSGKGLFQAIVQLSPDIICLDYNLPGSNGIELLKLIAGEFPHIAVVMITGDTYDSLRSAAAEAGAAGFIHKPFSQDQIIREFKQIVDTQRLLDVVKKSDEVDLNPPVRLKAIIVDDSKTIRALLHAILPKNGIQESIKVNQNFPLQSDGHRLHW